MSYQKGSRKYAKDFKDGVEARYLKKELAEIKGTRNIGENAYL